MKLLILIFTFMCFASPPDYVKFYLEGNYNNVEVSNGKYLIRAVDTTCKKVGIKLSGSYKNLFGKVNYQKYVATKWQGMIKGKQYCGAVLVIDPTKKLGVFK